MEQQMKLIKKAKKGDAHAFAQLYAQVWKDLYRMALYTLQNSQDAEDAVSDAVTDAWEQIGSLRKEESFRSWIFAILSNKCRRKRKEYALRPGELPEDLCGEPQSTEENLDVRSAFAELEDVERLILSLHIFGGYSSREIGNVLQLNENTVRSRQKRALDKMRAKLTQ